MVPGEVFLGDIFGLSTHAIPYWEEYKEKKHDNSKIVYDIVLTQYKQLLKLNINRLFMFANSELPTYRRFGY